MGSNDGTLIVRINIEEELSVDTSENIMITRVRTEKTYQ
jgi:hypothetical protein